MNKTAEKLAKMTDAEVENWITEKNRKHYNSENYKLQAELYNKNSEAFAKYA